VKKIKFFEDIRRSGEKSGKEDERTKKEGREGSPSDLAYNGPGEIWY